MNSQGQICTHIKLLTKKTLNALSTSEINNNCPFCQQPFIQNNKMIKNDAHLCLHCCSFLCSANCYRLHYENQGQTHLFSCKNTTKLLSIEDKPQPVIDIQCQKCSHCSVSQYNKSLICEENNNIEAEKQLIRFLGYLDKEIKPILTTKIADHIELNNAEEEEQQGVVCGLGNLGNTCYLNTTIQILFNIKKLRYYYLETKWGTMSPNIFKSSTINKDLEYFYDQILEQQERERWHVVKTNKGAKQNQYKLDIYHNTAIIKDTKFNEQFGDLIKILNQSQTTIQPIDFYYKIGQINHKYTLNRQQDAEELLYMILDCLSQGEFLKINNKQRYKKIEEVIGRQKLTITQKIFTSFFANHIICQKCAKQSWKLDLTYGLSVPLPKNKQKKKQPDISPHSIPNIKYYKELYYPCPQTNPLHYPSFLQPMFEEQKLTYAHNYWVCQHCQGLQALKKIYLLEEPQILLVSFKRFSHHNINTKISDWVQFGKIIDISSFCLSTSEQTQEKLRKTYKLIGVIVHDGRYIDTGHYICYVKKGYDWFKCSDSNIHKSTWNQVKSSQAYILAYQKTQ